ncbi:MAG: hypothetical protein AAGG69_04115 [Pseudomonadota bacterium]
MTFGRSYVAFMLAAFVATSIGAANASELVPQEQAALEKALSHMQSNAGVAESFAMCPADVYRTQMPFWRKLTGYNKSMRLAQCREDPVACADMCFNRNDPRACYLISRVFQDEEFGQAESVYAQSFAYACATGAPSGCTNRGASMRNAPLFDDPTIVLS